MADLPPPLTTIRVGLDVTPAVVAVTGLRRYTVELWKALAVRDDVELSAFALGRGALPGLQLPVRRVPMPLRVLAPVWRSVRWPRAETFAGRVDVVHNIALAPAPTRRPLVVTVHDTLPITHPDLYPEGAGDVQRLHLAATAHAAVVVTTCEATAEEIVDVTGFPRDRIVVAPLGTLAPDIAQGGSSRSAGDPFVLSVGAVTPRKGLAVLARAVAEIGPSCPEVRVVGPDWWAADRVRAEVRAADVHGRIRFLGRVDDAELAALYAEASVVCQPSLAEGFGMAVLEAMRFGAPVLATALPSVLEVAGDAAALAAPGNARDLAAELSGLLTDEGRRYELARRGRAQAARFTWTATAGRVTAAYRVAIGEAPSSQARGPDRRASGARSAPSEG